MFRVRKWKTGVNIDDAMKVGLLSGEKSEYICSCERVSRVGL